MATQNTGSANISFDRKYRPTALNDYVGNRFYKNHLLQQVKNKKLSQSILFEGDRGCGKTSFARLLAKEIFCQTPTSEGLSCGLCKMCTMITEKYILGGEQAPGIPIYEYDATKFNGKDDVVRIVQEMQARSAHKAKVFILDEAHRFSKEAQNSLLKILEEPKPWLYVFLCTTDPELLLTPVLSRVERIKIRRPKLEELRERLVYIAEQESISYEERALNLLISNYGRVPRESIKNFENVAKNGDVTYRRVAEYTNQVGSEIYLDYIASFNKDIFDALHFIEMLHEDRGIEYADFIGGLSSFIVDAFNMKMGINIDKYTEDEYKKVRKLFKEMNVRDMIRFMSLIDEAAKNRLNPKFALIMLTLRMGYPEYFETLTDGSIKTDLRKEQATSMDAYLTNKKEAEAAQAANLDLTAVADENFLLNLVGDGHVGVVDENFLSALTKKEETAEEDKSGLSDFFDDL